MTTPLEIPLSPTPQTFAIELNSVAYRMVVKWCWPAACWMFDLLKADGTALLQGIPIVTNNDLLGQFAYLGIGGQLTAQTDNNSQAVPTYANLGSTGHLYFITP
jgi:hypothetical protein